jgi:acyl-coenzyme A thioesterase PaaI-like protein
MSKKNTSASAAFHLWSTLSGNTLGRWLFSKIVCFKAPFFSTVSPVICSLENNLCVGYIIQKRSIQNHIGSVHAIALCNLAELCGGLMTDVSIPSGMRWIPKEMKVKYLQKAYGKIMAYATPTAEFYASTDGYEATVIVSLKNSDSIEVVSAEIKMWVSKKS